MSRRFVFPLFLLFMLAALPAHLQAQSGCDESPEAPTLILALVAGLGMEVSRRSAH